MGALGFVLACMAIWHSSEQALSFCSDSRSLVFYQRASHIYLYSYGGIKRDRIDVNGF